MKFMRFTHSDLHKELSRGVGGVRPQGAPGRWGEKGHRRRGSGGGSVICPVSTRVLPGSVPSSVCA